MLMRADYTVTAATQGSLVLLNVEPAALTARATKITAWVPGWEVRSYATALRWCTHSRSYTPPPPPPFPVTRRRRCQR